MYFYNPPNTELTHDRAFDVLNQLIFNRTPTPPIVMKYPQSPVENYQIWHLAEFPGYSGIYAVGGGNLIQRSIPSAISQNNKISLLQVFSWFPAATGWHWLACR
ncbi:hypothetical protein DP117_34375 [Brasilonema sp. UFV-L1]|nr:hypothetical protein [Brasilonema sp. UFV-L1]